MIITLETSDEPIFGGKYLTNDQVLIDLTHTSRRFETPRPALFLDRDGVIVVDAHYIGDPDKVELLPGAGYLIRSANESGIPVIVVTNQSGIGRGYFGWPEFERVQNKIDDLLKREKAKWNAVIACPHHKDALPPYRQENHPCRKPNPGMLFAARNVVNIDLSRSWIVGDKAGDLLAGKQAGLKGGVHVATHPDTAVAESQKAKELAADEFKIIAQDTVNGIWDRLTY